MNEFTILLHVVAASALSGLIGYERGKIEKPAGVRTNMLVGGAVARPGLYKKVKQNSE